MKFVMMSDTHYISRRMILDKEDKELMLQPAVSEKAVLQAADESDIIFIIGDLTDKGDRFSHEDFSAFLRKVKENGTKIYVTFATHDYHHHKAYVQAFGDKVSYKSCPWDKPYFDKEKICWKNYVKDEFASLSEEECTPTLVDALSPEEIWEMYREFGPDEAYSVNEASFSYCLDLDENTRCLMLNDIFRNEEAIKDLSPTYTPSCFRWIKQMYDEAKRDGKFIFVCSHHPMLPAVPAHRIGAGTRNRDMRSPVVGHTLADIGINLAFTGHSHFCNVGYLKSEKENVIYDITTPSVRFYPPAYRNIELDGLNGIIKYDCRYIDIPDGCDIAEENLFEHYHMDFYNEYYHKITGGNELIKKFFDKATVRDIYFLVKSKAKLDDAQFNSVKDIKLFDLIIDVAFNMLIGDGKYMPDTPEYKVLMSLCSILDSIIDTQPFVDVRNKFLGGYSISQIIEPMLFKNSVKDREGEFDFTKEPEKLIDTPVYKSYAGDILMAVIYVIGIAVSSSAPLVALFGIPYLTYKKKMKNKKGFAGPFYKYF